MAEKQKSIEAFALARVPKEQRKSWIDMVMVQAGMVICIPAFLLGSMLAEGMPTVNAVIAGVIGYLMVLFLTFILGMQGADLGIPTCAISTLTFGKKGTRLLVSSLFTISLIGFFGLQVNVCGEAFSTLMHEAFGIEIPVGVSSVFWGMVMVLIAVWGMEMLKNVDTLSVPLLLGIMLLGTFMAFRTLEDYFGTKFFAAISTELGGANTAYALHAACQLGVPIVDADPAGRSVPELQHSTFYVKGIPMTPIALATQFGDTMVISSIVNDMRSEDIIRAAEVASGNRIGVADHPVTGKTLRESVIPNALSYTLKLGEALRRAKENGEDAALSTEIPCFGEPGSMKATSIKSGTKTNTSSPTWTGTWMSLCRI